MTRLISILLLTAGVIHGTAVAQQCPTKDEMAALLKSAPDAETRVLMLNVAVNSATNAAASCKTGDILRWAASNLRKHNEPTAAIQALKALVARNESPHETAEAYRMIGQYYLDLSRLPQAATSFQSQLAIYDLNPDLLEHDADLVSSGVNQLSLAFSALGKQAEAASINERLLGADRKLFSEFSVTAALVRNASLYTRLKQPELALKKLDQLFQWYPQFGRDDGRAIGPSLSRASLQDPTRSTDGYKKSLMAIWNDPALSEFPGIIQAGSLLADACRRRGEAQEAMLVTDQLLQRVDQHENDWLDSQPNPKFGALTAGAIKQWRVTCLSTLSTADTVELPHLAWKALDRLASIETNPTRRQSILEMKAQLEPRDLHDR